jgi:hypothetical protein
VVSIVGFNPNLIRVRDLTLLVIHTSMYTRVQVWLKKGHGVGSWTKVDKHHHKYYFSFDFVQLVHYLRSLKELIQYLG